MSEQTIEQAKIFLSFTAIGAMIGVLFDFFRIIRRTEGGRAVTNICDAFFWLFGGIFFISCFYRVAEAELRIYIYAAVILGAALYFLLLSRFFVAAGVVVLKIITRIFLSAAGIILVPIRFFVRKTGKAALIVVSPARSLAKKMRTVQRKFDFQKKLLKKI